MKAEVIQSFFFSFIYLIDSFHYRLQNLEESNLGYHVKNTFGNAMLQFV